MKTALLHANCFDGYETKVNMKGDVKEYALNFLKIFNNVKNDSALLSVRNDYDNGVYVSWVEDSMDGIDKETVENWLSSFGDVERTDPILVYDIDDSKTWDYDYDKYWDTLVIARD